MSDRSGGANDGQLFQQMDDQERIYAPEQVPGDDRTAADEQDRGAQGSDLIPGVIPAVPAGGVTGSSTLGVGPAVVPIMPPADEVTDEEADRRGDL